MTLEECRQFYAIYSAVGMRDSQIEQELGKAMSSGKLFRMRSLRLDAHDPEDTCLMHAPGLCLSSAELRSLAAD